MFDSEWSLLIASIIVLSTTILTLSYLNEVKKKCPQLNGGKDGQKAKTLRILNIVGIVASSILLIGVIYLWVGEKRGLPGVEHIRGLLNR